MRDLLLDVTDGAVKKVIACSTCYGSRLMLDRWTVCTSRPTGRESPGIIEQLGDLLGLPAVLALVVVDRELGAAQYAADTLCGAVYSLHFYTSPSFEDGLRVGVDRGAPVALGPGSDKRGSVDLPIWRSERHTARADAGAYPESRRRRAAGYFAAFFLRAAQEAFIRSDTASFSLAVIGRRFLAGVAADAVSATGVAAAAGRRAEERRAAGFAGAEPVNLRV